MTMERVFLTLRTKMEAPVPVKAAPQQMYHQELWRVQEKKMEQ